MPPNNQPREPKWGKSEAKQLLWDNLKSGAVPMDMAPKDVFLTRPEYAAYNSDMKRFRGRLGSLKKQVSRPPKPPKKVKWAKSELRKLFWADLKSGETPMDVDPEDVFLTRPEYAAYDADIKRFKSRLTSLIEQCQARDDRAAFDAAAFDHDRAIHPFPELNFRGEPQWPDSDAEMWLRKRGVR
jgi:hypothetical protein